MAAVAAVTNKIKVGTSILNIVARNPVVCAKALTGIDILSSGRLFAGAFVIVVPEAYRRQKTYRYPHKLTVVSNNLTTQVISN